MKILRVKEKNDEVFGLAVVAVIYFLPIIILLVKPNSICIDFLVSKDWLVNQVWSHAIICIHKKRLYVYI